MINWKRKNIANGDENKIMRLIKEHSDITAKEMNEQTGFST